MTVDVPDVLMTLETTVDVPDVLMTLETKYIFPDNNQAVH